MHSVYSFFCSLKVSNTHTHTHTQWRKWNRDFWTFNFSKLISSKSLLIKLIYCKSVVWVCSFFDSWHTESSEIVRFFKKTRADNIENSWSLPRLPCTALNITSFEEYFRRMADSMFGWKVLRLYGKTGRGRIKMKCYRGLYLKALTL